MTDAYHQLREVFQQQVQFTNEQWQDIAGYWETVTVLKNDFIARPGVIEHYMYFIADGAARIYYLKNTEDVTVAFSYTGHFAGEATSFISRKPGVFNVQAVSDCQMLRLSHSNLQVLYDKYPAMERWGRLFIEQMMVGRTIRDIEMLAYSAEERFERMFEQSPHCFQMFSQKHLASYLGMSPETFSRIKKRRMG